MKTLASFDIGERLDEAIMVPNPLPVLELHFRELMFRLVLDEDSMARLALVLDKWRKEKGL